MTRSLICPTAMLWICRNSAVIALLCTAPAAIASSPTQPSAPAAAEPAFQLDTGDKLRVIVFGEDSLGGEFIIGSNGRVALPLVGDVAAVGLTPSEFQDKVTAALADGYLKRPRVSVEVLTYRPFYILGEVNKPGEYPYAKGLTVLSAVAQAQGFTYRAGTKKVFVRHAGDATETVEKLTASLPIRPGDTIRIKERWF